MAENSVVSIIENRSGNFFEKDYSDEKDAKKNADWLSEFLGFTKVITFRVKANFKKKTLVLVKKFCDKKISLEELICEVKEYVF